MTGESTERPFRTPDGTSVPAVTAGEMREVDRLATETFEIALIQMMENAGRTLAARTRDLASREEHESGITVLAGNGGNGGGGLVCARHLHNLGVPVRVVLDRPPGELDGAPARQCAILDAAGLDVAVGPGALDEPGVVVDALVGYGLDGPARGTTAALIEATNALETPVLSLDIPSGRDATTGAQPGPAVDPARVLTLAVPKTGLRGLDCPLALVDISLPAALYHRLDIAYERPFGERYWVPIATEEG